MASETKQESSGREIQSKSPGVGLTPHEETDRLFDSLFRRSLHSSWLRPWHFDWPTLPELTLPFNVHLP